MLNDARMIIEVLDKKGFESYFVGGCVRNMMMKRPLSDVDITTAAKPEEVVETFSAEGIHAIPTGIKYGTVTVILDGVNFDVTTFRKKISMDGRRSSVEFGTSLEEDLLRRDFTMNAIAYSPKDDSFIDPYNGTEDIKAKVIRAVGVPIERFREDYLRMIRAHRFQATLGFDIENKTLDALYCAAREDWQGLISPERIREEFNKCIKRAEEPSVMFEGMRKSGLLQEILPELTECFGFEQNRYHEYDLYCHTLRTVDGVFKEYDLIRWSALFHDLGKISACNNYGPDATFYGHERGSADIALRIMKRLKFSNEAIHKVLSLVKCHMLQYTDDMKDSSVRRLVASVGVENIEDLCTLWSADKRAKGHVQPQEGVGEFKAILERLESMSAEEKIFKVKDLAIGGKEVMEIKGIPSSPEVGEVLHELFDAVLEDTTLNTNEKLREMVLKM
ncbi:MAG: CCA tRNA nucleotidyltransferase [Deltaproteobacteria bacterium]|nr:CCA tRNA nucleotidyltransferase [Deltaproteobacteria bacterium]